MGKSIVNEDGENSPFPADLVALDVRIRLCRRCEEGGYIPSARPVVMDAGHKHGILLIGQAPGIVEHDNGVPFGGRAGRILFRWLESVGIEELQFRRRVYMGAVTRCFPGKNPQGSGDRKPSRPEIDLCRPWFDGVLQALEPSTLILVGGLAIERYLPGRRLDEIIGHRFTEGNRILVPLPHPSGASRWLNDSAHRELLAAAMEQVKALWEADIGRHPLV